MTDTVGRLDPADAWFAFRKGVQAQLPILIGVVPFGVIFGALAISAGIPPIEAQGFSILVFAGSAQFVAAGLVAGSTPAVIVVFTILVVNLRHMLYSATMSPYFQPLPARWKAALAWLLTDEAFAVGSLHYRRSRGSASHWFFLGTGLTLWGSWQLSTLVGIAVGAWIPAAWMLDFALPLTFMALLIPTLEDRPTQGSAIAAAVLSLALAGLPYRLGLLLAALLAVGLGVAMESLRSAPGSTTG
jgi:4-azaleucine resistance transporter AzlC